MVDVLKCKKCKNFSVQRNTCKKFSCKFEELDKSREFVEGYNSALKDFENSEFNLITINGGHYISLSALNTRLKQLKEQNK